MQEHMARTGNGKCIQNISQKM